MEIELSRQTVVWKGRGNSEPLLLCTILRWTRDLSISEWQKKASPSLQVATDWLDPMDGTFTVGLQLRFWAGVLFSSLATFHAVSSRLLIR